MRWHTTVVAVATALLVALGGLVTAAAASAVPVFEVPFPCQQVWSGQTGAHHAPANAVDFNRDGDGGDPVVASAPGAVTAAADLGDTGYGRYLRIDHGGGWQTLYAHLAEFAVAAGQRVRYGQVIGRVGSTGASTGPHLHYEQRLDGRDVRVRFKGEPARYWGTRSYTSDNNCTGGAAPARVVTGGIPLAVRSGPGMGYGTTGAVLDGAVLTVSCQAAGGPVRGTHGTSTVWDRIGAGRFVADVYLETGHGGFVPGVPRCP